jgi:hypothetical protein
MLHSFFASNCILYLIFILNFWVFIIVGYNPINGESYSTKDGLNSKVEQAEPTENEKESVEAVKTPEEENAEQSENGDVQAPADATANGNDQAPVDKPTNGHKNETNGHNTAKVR